MNLIFMDEALDDIETIRDFLAHAGATQVEGLVGEIYNAAERLVGFPEIGVRVSNSEEWGDVITACDIPVTRMSYIFCGCGTKRRMKGICDS